MTIERNYLLTGSGLNGYKLTPRATTRTEQDIIKNRTSGMWLTTVEGKNGHYILRAQEGGRNLYWRRSVTPHVACPTCGLRMEEVKGPVSNENLGEYRCRCCEKYSVNAQQVEDALDIDQLVADLHQQYLKAKPKANSKATNAVKEKAASADRITFSRETEEALRKMARRTPSSQRPGYSVITMGISAHVDRLQALNRLGGVASDKDLRAEIAKVRHYNNL